MCGRFVSREQAAIEREYNIKVRNPFERVYNAAPTMSLPVVVQGEGKTREEREALAMRWGLIPSWWTQPNLPTSTINARSEEAAAKPMWRAALRHNRCRSALGWYEWQSEARARCRISFTPPEGRVSALPVFGPNGRTGRRGQLGCRRIDPGGLPVTAALHHRMPWSGTGRLGRLAGRLARGPPPPPRRASRRLRGNSVLPRQPLRQCAAKSGRALYQRRQQSRRIMAR
jgi:hypothetical protein